MAQERVAIVTGANRGIGLEVTRQLADLGYTVVLGSRDLGKGEAAAKKLKVGDRVLARRLDVTEQSTIDRLRDEIATTFGPLHVLVNNAAIHYDTWENAADADLRIVHEALDTNLFGAWRMCQAFIPLLRKSKHGRIVNVPPRPGPSRAWAPARPRTRSARLRSTRSRECSRPSCGATGY